MTRFLMAAAAVLMLASGPVTARTTSMPRPGMPSIRPAMPSVIAPRVQTPRVTMPKVGSTPAERAPLAPSRPLNTYSVRNNVVLFGILFGGLTAVQAKHMDAAKVTANCAQAVADGKLPPGLNCNEISLQALKEIQ